MTAIILALDTHTCKEALELVETTDKFIHWVKVGHPLYIQGGNDFVKELANRGKYVFLDLKWRDIPNTITKTLRSIGDIFHRDEVRMCTLDENLDTAKAALMGRGSSLYPKLIAVPYLTSQSATNPYDVNPYSRAEITFKTTFENPKSSVDGVVVPAGFLHVVPDHAIKVIKVVPGIRTSVPAQTLWDKKDDHVNTLTAQEAANEGADYLVVGRPIIKSRDPRSACIHLLDDMHKAENQRSNRD